MSDLRDIATLCKEIDYLTAQVDTLRKERDEARREVCEWATCKQLTKERDEARRCACATALPSNYKEWESQQIDAAVQLIAQQQGWDCFKETK